MKRLIFLKCSLLVGLLAGCASSARFPPERVAASEAAVRAAENTGAASVENPSAQLHLRIARDQLELAKRQLAQENYHRADMLLLRARVDAELAQALAENTRVHKDADEVQAKIRELRAQLAAPPPPRDAEGTAVTPPVPGAPQPEGETDANGDEQPPTGSEPETY